MSRDTAVLQPPPEPEPETPDALVVLEKIVEVGDKIEVAQKDLASLFRERDEYYLLAQDTGCTIAEIADASGTSVQGVKYMLARAKSR